MNIDSNCVEYYVTGMKTSIDLDMFITEGILSSVDKTVMTFNC